MPVISNYSEKSFVVRGDDTKEHKDTLKNMGGKWNSGLTDKETGEKFGAWIFWSDKRQVVEQWLKTGCKKVVASESSSDSLEKRVKKLEETVRLLEARLSGQCEVESDDDVPTGVARKRLL